MKERNRWSFYSKLDEEHEALKNSSWSIFILYPMEIFRSGHPRNLQLANVYGDYRVGRVRANIFLFINQINTKSVIMRDEYKTVELALWTSNFIFRERNIFSYNPDYTKALEQYYEYEERGKCFKYSYLDNGI